MSIFENNVIVNKKASLGNKAGRWICILLIIFCLYVSFFLVAGVLLVPAILIGVIYYLLYLNAQIEYEYTYIEGRLSIAKIKAKRKRKELARVEMEEVILIAPSNSHELDSYYINKQISRRACISGSSDVHTYQVVFKSGKGIEMIEFEPNQSMLEMIRGRNPRKVLI